MTAFNFHTLVRDCLAIPCATWVYVSFKHTVLVGWVTMIRLSLHLHGKRYEPMYHKL